MNNIEFIMTIVGGAMLILALIAPAVVKLLTYKIGVALQNATDEMKVNAAFRRRWDRNTNTILITYRQLLWDLQNMDAPKGEIEAVKRQIRHYENLLKNTQVLVSAHGIIKRTVIGGYHELRN